MKREILSCTYRPDLKGFPNIALPFYPRSTGHFQRVLDEEFVPAGMKNFVQFFWCVKGEGELFLEGEWMPMHPGDVVYRLPMEEHRLRSRNGEWEYRWIAFDGPGARDFMLSYGYPRTCFHAGICPHELFISFENHLRDRTPYAWRQMVADVVSILAAAGGCNEESSLENRILRETIRICKENFGNPNLNVNALAERLEIDRSTLRRIFRKKMNQLPSEYLSQLRLQHAFSMLKQTFLPLSEIACRSGFQDVNYFCRVIRKSTGRTPSELRS